MFEKQVKIPSPEEMKEKNGLSPALTALKRERDELVKDVLSGRQNKFLLIVGPCSAHESAPVLEYIRRLSKVNERVKDKVVIVPRIYTNKPRTRGVGYKGMFSQPDPNSKENIARGIETIRRLHIDAMELSGLSAADEMLYPENYPYVEDLLSYVAIGARSCENQMHRLVSSGMDVAVGMKNPMSGSVPVLMNSIFAAQSKQVFKYNHYQVQTQGNPYTHAVLRGMVDSYGNDIPNFHYETVMDVARHYEQSSDILQNPAIVIDTNHSNSGKQFRQQIRIVEEVLQNRKYDPTFKKIVKGFMIESFLVEGNQPRDEVFGQSITDPCLGWEDTERLIYHIAEQV